MILYGYSTDEGEWMDEWFERGKEPETIERDGKLFKRDFRPSTKRYGKTKGYPIYETASAVLPDQKAKVEAYCREQGVPTEFVRRGHECCPKIEDHQHRTAYHYARGFYDRDGGYSDAQKS